MCFQFLNNILEIKLLLYQDLWLLLFTQELKQFKTTLGVQKDRIGGQLQCEWDPVQLGHQELGQDDIIKKVWKPETAFNALNQEKGV